MPIAPAGVSIWANGRSLTSALWLDPSPAASDALRPLPARSGGSGGALCSPTPSILRRNHCKKWIYHMQTQWCLTPPRQDSTSLHCIPGGLRTKGDAALGSLPASGSWSPQHT